MRWCASKDAGPRRGVDWRVPHPLDKGMSASENVEPQRRVDCEIPHRLREENEAFFV